MSRLDQKKSSALTSIAVFLVTGVVFVSDLYTPLGIASWIFYLIPVVVSYFLLNPQAPLGVAAMTTVLLVGGYFLSPAGMDPGMARLNRFFGSLTIWTLAGVGFQFIRARVAVRRQEWLQTGQTLLSEKMTGDLSLQALGENALGLLARHLDAQAGAIFIEQGGAYRRFATYGVPAGAPVAESFQSGEGLLGQAVKDRRNLTIRDVPEGYLTIGSGLGQALPRHLLIAPLMVEGKVNAVVELGFFHPVTEADNELLARVSESIAVAVRSAYYRGRLQELLEATQRQSEELQVQTEELRVSNEELGEQGRALTESQARLEQQHAELEQTNSQLEEQARALEVQSDELGRINQSLEARSREIEQASRYKSEFLANMSHELRTPLNSSLILAKLLAANRPGNLTPDQVKFAQTIESAGNDLLALINDVLDLAKVEAGRMEIHTQQVGLERLVENLASMVHPVAQQKGIGLQSRIAPQVPATIETDSQRLEQVLKNLLSNAIKFTETGEVALEVSRAPDGRVAFAVRDTGIGIAQNEQGIIFEPFCQADGTTNRKYGGTGLGLSISRELVRILGGEIQLQSVAGIGSTFTVLLPERFAPGAAFPQAIEPPARLPASPAPIRQEVSVCPAPHAPARVADDRGELAGNRRVILIVEDDEAFARILCDLAHELHFQCLVANTSAEALTLAAQYTPNAVLLDLGLPDSSGLTVLDRLKSDARTRHIPVHVVSGSDSARTALSLGAIGYMQKPVKREDLMETLQRLEIRLTQKLRRVLIVEDDLRQLESLGHLLASADVDTVGAGSAAECLEKLRENTFDCMVLDLSLPDASGFSLLETLSQEDRYSFPPVIVYTGRDLSAEEEQRLRKYSKSIIIKGAKSPERLLDEVTLFLHQVVAELPDEQQKMLQKAHSRDAALEGRHILVAEDDVRNVFALTAIFEPHGVKLQIARNGREALAALERTLLPGGVPVDLVLMDVMMPEMDGLTATREIRKRAQWKKLPIIALTAKAMKNDQEDALEAGVNDYMAKPLDVEKLLSLVRVWIPR